MIWLSHDNPPYYPSPEGFESVADPLPQHEQHESRVADQVSPPQSARLHQQSEQPLQRHGLNPAWRSTPHPGLGIQCRPHRHDGSHVQLLPILLHPDLLLRRAERHADQIRSRIGNRSPHPLQFRRIVLEAHRRTIRSANLKTRIAAAQVVCRHRRCAQQPSQKEHAEPVVRRLRAHPLHQIAARNPLRNRDTQQT